VKALHLHLGQEAWGHVVAHLLRELPKTVVVTADLNKLPRRQRTGVSGSFVRNLPQGAGNQPLQGRGLIMVVSAFSSVP